MMSEKENLITVFEYALSQEYTGMSFFTASIERLQYGSAAGAFKKLVTEEQKHIDFISGILEDLKCGRDLNPQGLSSTVEAVAAQSTDFFSERSGKELLDQTVAESMIPDVTIFNVAWLIEKDLVEFYDQAARRTEGAVADALGLLSDWERSHEIFFRNFRDRLTRTYAQMPWGG
jgi:rubrerythrin